jgi:hypothetical protein
MYSFLEAGCKNKCLHEAPPAEPKPEQAREALEAFYKVFLDMKILHIYPIGEALEFHFVRRTKECCPANGDDDGKWRSEIKAKAA